MPKRPIRIDDILKITFVGDPQISPDGGRILFTRKHINDKNKYVTHLCTVDMDGKVQQWTQAEGGNSHGRWSPDGETFAFISGRDKPSPQIYILSTGGGEGRKLTNFPEGVIGGFKWAPNGKKIACLFRETHPNWTEKAKKEREDKGLSSPPWELDDIWYRLDGDGYFGGQRFKLYIVDIETGEHTMLYDACPLGQYSYDWSPNSAELAVIHTVNKRPMAEEENDQIFRVDMQGQAWKLEGLPTGPKGGIQWSPDGKWLAYGGRHTPQDPWGARNTRLWICAADGGSSRCLTENDDYCLGTATLSDTKEASYGSTIVWAPDSKAIYLEIGHHGESQLAMCDISKGGVEFLTRGQHSMVVGNVSREGSKIACTFGTTTKLHEIGVYDLDKESDAPTTITNLNKSFHEEIKLSEPEEVWLESEDGHKVHGWVMKPIDYLEPKRYPAILEIHGGPHTQYGWAFFHEFQVLAAEGYVVVYSNPRGSKGYGEDHCAVISGDWGNRDWVDIQTFTHWMQHQPYIHPGQLGVMGGSYGGYMTNWAVGHSDAYKAAITDRCVSNMVSMAGNSDFPFNKNGYFKGIAWGDHQDIKELWAQSPIAYFKKVKTPMLIIHSEGDLRCNIEQSEQVFTALQQEGIESRFVRYPSNTSHGMSRNGPPDLRMHRLNEITAWWRKHLS